MAIKVRNQAPQRLDPAWALPASGPVDPMGALREHVCDPLMTPATAGAPVSVTEDDGQGNVAALTADDVACAVLGGFGALADPQADYRAKQVLSQCLLNWGEGSALTVPELYLAQALGEAGLPAPSEDVEYTADFDVVPDARAYLAGEKGFDAFFCSLGSWARPTALGYAFDTAAAWADFQAWLAKETAPMAQLLPADCASMVSQLCQMPLENPLEALVLRDEDNPGEEDLCLARLLPTLLNRYATQVSPDACHLMPFHAGELAWPAVLALVNVEEHARCAPARLQAEWDLVADCIDDGPKVLSKKDLTNLTEVDRQVSGLTDSNDAPRDRSGGDAAKSAKRPFMTEAPSNRWMIRRVRAIMEHIGRVDRSHNTYKSRARTFARANRRDPDDFNLKGCMDVTRYRPDIHVYLDTSGSINEEMYASGCKCCIALAKELGVSLYFTSFSHVVGPTTRLHTDELSVRGAYRELVRLDKVTGGTDFEQVWKFINQSPARRRELSIVITDFEYSAPADRVRHPKRLYYAPVVPDYDWGVVVDDAGMFCDSMKRHEPKIRDRILM